MDKSEEARFMEDDTNIEYTVSGSGPKLLQIHDYKGSIDTLFALAEILDAKYTVYCADRRGWGNSGPKGPDYSMDKECADAIELMTDNDIEYIFGSGYGAVIALHVALRRPVKKLILFEPFLMSLFNMKWIPKLTRQVQKGDYFSALVTFVKGVSRQTRFVPGFFLKLLFKRASVDRDKQLMKKIIKYEDPDVNARYKKDIESNEWKYNKRILRNVAVELYAAEQSEAELTDIASLRTETLLICERDSEPYVYDAVDNILALMPAAKKIVVDLSDDKNRVPLVPPPADLVTSMDAFLSDKAGQVNV
jgi:pimeloyl-ACP methyl ester carboxylesterase